ncbi:MAG: methyltransferase domain-containing protein [Candidatus Eisenbacteria bacterium]|uniref:Methyltransferase domain-containing protein n=1 Tax=Eiseniibacteriota bacterium TaxID=2212470 RepID=A0A937X7U6_UNCEI|nr:methyltransferase domain-containing protein [Candidatus Eisenbacteria bacterium]
MQPDERGFYEINENWERFVLTPELAEKARALMAMVPPGVRRVLDVGCGNGVITHELARQLEVVGIDWSRAALSFVRVPRICASSAALPVRAGAFDLLFCSEMLEHLLEHDFLDTLDEFRRLGTPYLLLSVPNGENLQLNELLCRDCGRVFNASRHQRRFTAESLAAHFPEYRLLRAAEGGRGVRAYPTGLLRLRQRLGGRRFQVPEGRIAMCPGCGNRSFPRSRHNPVSLCCDGLNRLISRRRPYWLYALLARQAE